MLRKNSEVAIGICTVRRSGEFGTLNMRLRGTEARKAVEASSAAWQVPRAIEERCYKVRADKGNGANFFTPLGAIGVVDFAISSSVIGCRDSSPKVLQR